MTEIEPARPAWKAQDADPPEPRKCGSGDVSLEKGPSASLFYFNVKRKIGDA
jgi:hypothetical protein